MYGRFDEAGRAIARAIALVLALSIQWHAHRALGAAAETLWFWAGDIGLSLLIGFGFVWFTGKDDG